MATRKKITISEKITVQRKKLLREQLKMAKLVEEERTTYVPPTRKHIAITLGDLTVQKEKFLKDMDAIFNLASHCNKLHPPFGSVKFELFQDDGDYKWHWTACETYESPFAVFVSSESVKLACTILNSNTIKLNFTK